jgi:DNA-binding MarR family transcriptional regulator
MDRTTLTAALKPLQKQALVEIIADTSDRRSRLLLLTPKGSELLAKAVTVWRESHTELENNLLNGTGDNLRSMLLTLGNITPA